MPPTETGERAPTRDAAVPEKQGPQPDRLLAVLIIGLGSLLTLSWFCGLALLALWLIRAIL